MAPPVGGGVSATTANSNPAPAWSLNKSASRTYACKTSIDLCRDTSRILNTDAPRRAALVRKPERSECAPKSVAFDPTCVAYAFTRSHTDLSVSRRRPSLPPFATGRNNAPSVICAAASHALIAFTGHVAPPRTMAIVCPWPSWSVFDRRMVTRMPSSVSSKSPTSRATSSERRKAPAKPSKSSARSRRPLRLSGVAKAIARTISASAGDLRAGAAPSVRRMPLSVARTHSEPVGASRSARRCA